MPRCNKCEDQNDYKLYQDRFEIWRLGTEIDVNIYREHVCVQKPTGPTKYYCFKCGAAIPFKNPCIHKRLAIQPEKKIGYF